MQVAAFEQVRSAPMHCAVGPVPVQRSSSVQGLPSSQAVFTQSCS
ncbi:hypothetical protein COEX109129_39920 [Corallococcus exiguus]